MSLPPRRRTFGERAATIPASAARAIDPVELHYSTGGLVRQILIAVGLGLAAFWIIRSGGPGADYHGPGAALVRLLGPQGMIALFAMFGLGCAILGVAHLRLLVDADRRMASATGAGLAISGPWGRKSYAWQDIVAIRLHITRARSREIAFIKIERLGGRSQLVPTSAADGGRASVEAWIQEIQIFLVR